MGLFQNYYVGDGELTKLPLLSSNGAMGKKLAKRNICLALFEGDAGKVRCDPMRPAILGA